MIMCATVDTTDCQPALVKQCSVYNEHVILQEHELPSQTYTLAQETYPNSPVPHKTTISSDLQCINEIITVTTKITFLLLQVTEFLAYCHLILHFIQEHSHTQ
jgi:hypothetical protein